jgi:hypothetical protein
MTFALYASIWIALGLFALAEAGRTRLASPGGPARWAWGAWTAGGVLVVVHVLVALDLRYNWDHALAVSETARRSAEVYGSTWRGGVYVNYLFVLVWFGESWRWRRAQQRDRRLSPAVTWALRGFFLLIIANAAIVFVVHSASRVAGVLLVAGLLWVWLGRDNSSRTDATMRLFRTPSRD